MTKTKPSAAQIAARTKDAYSFKAYHSWAACAQACLDRGYTEAQTEEILRSKFTRWADDSRSTRKGKATSADLGRFLDDPRNKVRETFAPRTVAKVSPDAAVISQIEALASKLSRGGLILSACQEVRDRMNGKEA